MKDIKSRAFVVIFKWFLNNNQIYSLINENSKSNCD